MIQLPRLNYSANHPGEVAVLARFGSSALRRYNAAR